MTEGGRVAKDAFRALGAREHLFKTAFHSSFGLLGILLPDGTLLEVNEAARALTGRPASEFIGQPVWKSYWFRGNPAAQSRLRADVARARSGEFVRYDLAIQDSRGAPITIDLSLKPIQGEDGSVAIIVAEGRDVTAERKMLVALAESEQRFRLAMRNAPIGKVLVDATGRHIEVNQALCAMLGFEEKELLTKTFQDVTHPDDLEVDQRNFATLLAGDRDSYQLCKRYIRKDGEIIEAQLDMSVLRNAAGIPIQFISQVQDITERRRLEEQQRALTQRLSLALWVAGIGVWDFALSNDASTWDRWMYKMYGVPEGTAITKTFWRSLVLPEDLGRVHAVLESTITHQNSCTTEFRIVHPRLGVRFMRAAFGVVLDSNGKASHVVGVNLDETEQWQAEQRLNEVNRQLERRVAEVTELQERLREQAIRDPLTGLFNRRFFSEALTTELARAAREHYGLSLVIADLDHFKQVNDRHGHRGGDAVLQAWADLLRQQTRTSDVLCRYGGEEFVVLLPHISLEDAVALAESWRAAIECLPVLSPNEEVITATVSLGVAHVGAFEETSADALLHAADSALYVAKGQGRNRVAYAHCGHEKQRISDHQVDAQNEPLPDT